MRDHGLITTRVIQVLGNCEVDLENGDYLCDTDDVKVIPQSGDKRLSSFRPFSDYDFIVSSADSKQVRVLTVDACCAEVLS